MQLRIGGCTLSCLTKGRKFACTLSTFIRDTAELPSFWFQVFGERFRIQDSQLLLLA